MENDHMIREIVDHIQTNFSVSIQKIEPYSHSPSTRRWVVTTDQEDKLFVENYCLNQIESLKTALKIQDKLNDAGVVCPRVYHQDNQFVFTTHSGYIYYLMSYWEGEPIQSGEASWLQMYDLGRVIGYMHYVLDDIPSGRQDWTPSRLTLLHKWRTEWEKSQSEETSIRIRFLLKRQRELIDEIDMKFLQSCQSGWAHSNLWAENIFYQGHLVSGMIGFDQMKYVYPHLDIARIILTGAFSMESGMDLEKAAAFLSGYRLYRSLSMKQVASAFQLLWCLEAPRCFTADIETKSIKEQRLFEENCWIMEHWWDLEEVLDI
jgi:homoserine kinase type II